MAFTQVIKTLGSVMASMKTAVDTWLSQNITNPSNPPLDRSLSLSNACAPADMVGNLENEIDALNNDKYYGSESADWINGAIQNANTNPMFVSNTTRLTTKQAYAISRGTPITLNLPNGWKHRILFTVSFVGELAYNQQLDIVQGYTDDTTGFNTELKRTIIAPECAGFIVTIGKVDNSTISPTDIPNDIIYIPSIKTDTLNEAENIFTTFNDFARNIGYYISSDKINVPWRQGYYAPNTGSYTSSTTRCCLNSNIDITSGATSLTLEMEATMKGRLTFVDVNGTVISTSSDREWTNGTFNYNVPTGAVKVKVSIAFIDNSTITPENCTTIKLFEILGTLSEDAKYFEGKKISILGDSISTFAGADAQPAGDGHTIADGTYTYAGNHCRYPNSYLSNVDDTYWMKLINSLGMVLGVNDSWAGSRVSWNGTQGSDYGVNIYIASPTRIGHLDDNGTPDIILVNAGTNDIGLSVTIGTFNTENPVSYTDQQIANLPVATFADAYRAMLIRLQKAYPLAKIVVMLPNYTTSYYNPTKADQYLEIIKEACDFFGVPWVDMRTTGITMYNTGTYTGDGIHPNVAGMNLLYEKLRKFFEYTL